MSLAQTMKELETANKALEGQLAALQAETDKLKTAHAESLAALQTTVSERDTTIADLTKQLATASRAADEAAKLRTGLEAKVASLTADLDKARAALANPAFADAAARGQTTPPRDGGEPKTAKTDDQFLEAYKAEQDPVKRAVMWREHVGEK